MRPRAALFALILLTLTQCASPEEATPESVPPTPTPEPTATPEPTQEPQPMITSLNLWLPQELDPYGERPGADLLSQQLDDFNEAHPDVLLDVTVKAAHDRGGLLDLLRTASGAAPSILPDLVVLDAADLETAVRADLVQPLDQILPSSHASDLLPFAVQMGRVDEQTYGFVFGSDMQILAYRRNVVASPPITWTQVVSPPMPFVFAAGGQGHQVNDATLIQYLAAGGHVVDTEGSPALDEAALISVLTFYSDCIGSGTLSPMVALDISDADEAWEQFQAGWGDVAVVPASRYVLEGDDSIAIASLPTRDGRPFSIARGWVIAIVTDDPARQELAAQVLEWLVAADRHAEWTQAAGYLPGTRSALQRWDAPGGERVALRNVMEAAVPPPRREVLATVGPAMQAGLESVLRGLATPEEAAAEALQMVGQ